MMTVDFVPHFGAETTHFGGGDKLSNVPVYLIFWGSYWTSNGQKATDIVHAAQGLYSSPYLSGLTQYGSDGRAHFAGSRFDTSDPPTNFSQNRIQDVVQNAIDNLGLPEPDSGSHEPIYFVVTPPGASSNVPNAASYHSAYTHFDFPFDFDHTTYGWIGGGSAANGSIDTYSYFLSHETVEAMTDPNPGDGITVDHGATWTGGGDNEIADAEAQNYVYRVNGVRVESYWSAADNAYIVPDGNAQSFVYTPVYNSANVYVGSGDLTILGDQFGANFNDTITVDIAADGGMLVTQNGETVHFDPGAIHSISINAFGGDDKINVERLPSNISLSINTGFGSDTVNITPTLKNMGFVQGQVGLSGSSIVLNIDDSANTTSSLYSVSSVSVSRPGAGAIGYSGVTSLNLNGGSGNDLFNVDSTASGTSTVLRGNDGADTFNLTPTGDNLDALKGSIDLLGGAGVDSVVILDQSNPSASTYSLSVTSFSRPGAASVGYSGDENVLLFGGSNDDTYNIESTELGAQTSIVTGTGNDTINVVPTSNDLRDIQGALDLSGIGGSDTINLHDEANANAATYSITSSSVSRAGAAAITYLLGGTLSLAGGTAADVYNVESTLAGTTVSISAGASNDAFNVAPTSKSLANIAGPLNLFGNGGTDSIVLHDELNMGPATYAIHSASVARSGAATIGYGTDESLRIAAGVGNDTAHVIGTSANTPIVLQGGGGVDTLVGPDATNTWNLWGAGTGSVANVTFSAFENLTGGSVNDTFRFTSFAAVTGTINGGAGVNTLDDSAYPAGVSINLAAGTATATGGIANIQNITGTAFNDHLTGNAAANVISANGGVDVIAGGGGNDTIILGNTQGAATTVTDGAGSATLVGPNVANTWTLIGVGSGNVNGIAFSGIANLTGGSANDVFKFGNLGALAGKVNGGAGANTLDYTGRLSAVTVNLATAAATATAGFLSIQAFVGGSASDTLVGPNAASTWSINGANSGTVGTFSYSAVEGLTGGSANDVFKFGALGSQSGMVNGGAGVNTLDYSTAGAAATVNLATNTATRTGGIANIQAVAGSTIAGDRLIGTNAASTWKVTAQNAGTLNGTFSFSGVENLVGGSAVDIFQMSSGATVSGKIDGGGGGDWLDESAYLTPVTVDLTLGTATGASGGIANIRNVIGGAGGNTLTGNAQGNVLVGGAGIDTIKGGSGRSVLIGGKGVDKVTGGSSDDVIIGNSTSFDHNEAALASILAEWQSANTYAQRINHLKLGGGLNGANTLVLGVSVPNDLAADVLAGGAGSDWFLKDALDSITDVSATEIVN